MAESIHEQLAEAIRTSLAAIVGNAGATYWYAPGAVTRVSWDDERLLDPAIIGPIYAVRAGDEEHTEGVGKVVDVMANMHVLVAQRFTAPETPLVPASPSRATVVNRMVRDVLRKLLEDVQLLSLGGAVDNVFAGQVIVDRDRYVDGWALAEITFPSSYRYLDGVP